MSDVEYVTTYLERHYGVYLEDETNVFFRNFKSTRYSFHDLIQELVNVFGFNGIEHMALNWLDVERRALAKDVNDFLRQYRVRLGRVDWLAIDKYGNELTCQQLCKALRPYYDTDEIIETYYNEWKENKVIETCEKMIMG